jgi:hypothetical protein
MKIEYRPSLVNSHLLPLGCLVFLVATLFGAVLFADRQFGYRDAWQTYYPLYKRIQAEWDAGRWPLWLTEVNGGMPLLGNPVSAVLYPGKVVYALLPYAWAARLYIVMHIIIACGDAFLLARHWQISLTGSALAGLSYAFAGPVLFQYCNVVFLVGAAWLPLGLLAADRWLVGGKRTAPWELAVVLSLQVLGGDLESAYLLGASSVCYAIWLSSGRLGPKRFLLVMAIVAAYYIFQLYLALQMARSTQLIARGLVGPTSVLRWLSLLSTCAAWGLLLALAVNERKRLAGTLAGLAAAGGLAIALCAAQLGPTLEFSSLSVRAANVGILDIYPFSLNPMRIAEFFWPNVFGTLDRGNRLWLGALPPTRAQDFWVPSLYVGALGSILACGSAGVHRAPPWRGLATGMFVVGLLGGLGEYGSPLLWARQLPRLLSILGPLDSSTSAGVRIDGCLRDGDGSPYWLLTTALPGFDGFRFPSKLLTTSCLGLVMLAGLGWDETILGKCRRTRRCATAALLATLALVGLVAGRDSPIERFLGERAEGLVSTMGPFDLTGAVGDLHASLWHAIVALSITLLILVLLSQFP